jgi:hypothetical protein
VGSIVNLSFSEEDRGSKSIDGYEWKSWENLPKLNFATGFVWGVMTARWEGVGHLQSFASMAIFKTTEVDPKTKEWVDEAPGNFAKRLDLSEISSGQIVDGLDNFYKDYRNMTVLVQEAIWIVKLEVRGAPQEFIDEEARLLRMPNKGERFKEWSSLWLKNQAYREAWDEWVCQMPLILYSPLFAEE